MTISHTACWLAGAFAAIPMAGLCLAQQEVAEDKVPHLQMIEELEKDLDAAMVENLDLQSKVKNLSSANGVLAESLSESKRELEALRESYQEALVRLELLSGVLEREDESLEDRLLKAASDLRLAEEEKEQTTQALVELMQASEAFAAAVPETDEQSEIRAALKAALTASEEALGLFADDSQLEERTLDKARVITVNKEYNLVLVDVGRDQGLRVGTPVSFHRKDRIIGSALVISVRADFSGAILLELTDPNDQIMVDDRMRIAPEGV